MTAQPTRDQLRALANAATEGPWYTERRSEDYYDLTTVYNVFHNGDTLDRDLVAEVAYDNAEFIAAARTAVPQLLDQLDQAEARIKAWEKQYAHDLDQANAHIDAAETRLQAIQDLVDQADIAGDWTVTCSRLQWAIDGETV